MYIRTNVRNILWVFIILIIYIHVYWFVRADIYQHIINWLLCRIAPCLSLSHTHTSTHTRSHTHTHPTPGGEPMLGRGTHRVLAALNISRQIASALQHIHAPSSLSHVRPLAASTHTRTRTHTYANSSSPSHYDGKWGRACNAGCAGVRARASDGGGGEIILIHGNICPSNVMVRVCV